MISLFVPFSCHGDAGACPFADCAAPTANPTAAAPPFRNLLRLYFFESMGSLLRRSLKVYTYSFRSTTVLLDFPLQARVHSLDVRCPIFGETCCCRPRPVV